MKSGKKECDNHHDAIENQKANNRESDIRFLAGETEQEEKDGCFHESQDRIVDEFGLE